MRMSMTSRTSSLAGVVLIEVLSSGNCGTGREYIPAVVLIPRFHPVIQEIISYCSIPRGFERSRSFHTRFGFAQRGFLWGKPTTGPFPSVSTDCDTALTVLFSSGRSVTEFAPPRSITCDAKAVTKDIVSDLIPATGSLIFKFLYLPYPIHSCGLSSGTMKATAASIY